MIASPDGGNSFCFRGWELRPAQRQLFVRGAPVEVGARAFDVLLALAERRARTVSKEELLAVVWPGRVVEENNISVQIATLRRLLGPMVITTVSGVGYRLTAEIETAASPLVVERPVSLPRAAPLFGREQELKALRPQVGSAALVSITGPGGVGKTSLARQVLQGIALDPPLATYWVDLAPLQSGAALPAWVAAQIDVSATMGNSLADLLAALSRARALIALDNCEHVVADVTRLVGAALRAAPGVRWMVTSQVPLRLAGEYVHQVQPLQVPARDVALAEAVRSGAVALLKARVEAAYRPFELTAANIGVAIDICRQLDGLPLAIEMVASRVAMLGLDTVHEQLDQKLRLSNRDRDGPSRQRTLHCTFDWSYGLLTLAEQRVFRCLEPFLGGFTARMVRQMVCDDDEPADGPRAWEALEALSVLVERSLVHRVAEGGTRYVLFESARDFARAQLRAAGELDAVRQRHAEVVAYAFAEARGDYDRMRDEVWAAKYLPERDNVRAALQWSCAMGAPDLLARLVSALAQIDTFSRAPAEIVRCGVPMDKLLQASPRWRAAACVEFSWAHFLDGNRKTGTELARRALDDFNALGDEAGAYLALAQLIRLYESRPGMMSEALEAVAALGVMDEAQVPLRSRLFRAITAGMQYSGERTVERLQELHELAVRSGFDTLAAVCRVHITDQLLIDGRYDEAVEAARRFDSAGEQRPRVRATILVNLTLALARLGRSVEAAEPAQRVLRTLPSATNHVIAAFALAAVRAQRYEDAALMMGYCERVRRERDQRADPAEAAAEAEVVDRLSDALAATRLLELRRLGSAMSLEEAWSFIP